MVEYGRALHRGLPATWVALALTVASCNDTTKPGAGDSFNNGDGGLRRDTGVDATALPEASVADSYVGDVAACEAGLTFCGGGCVDTNKDPSNCGMCTNQCGGVFQCVGGQCLCPVGGGQAICNNTCVNTATDPGNCGACGHTCQGSVCAASLCQPTVVATQNGAAIGDIAVDPQNIYFSQVASGSDHGRVVSKPFAGSSPGVFIDSTLDPGLFDPHGIHFDNHNMYWVDTTSGAIESFSPISGAYGLLRPSMLGDGGISDRPLDIVSDGHDVYWATFDGGQILSVPIGGGPQTVIATGEDHPHAIAFDASNIYWVDFGGANPSVPSGSVRQAPKRVPSTPTTLVVLSANENQPWDVAVDDTSVYWTLRTNPGLVRKVPIGGGTVVTLARGQGSPYGIAVDADFVYWTNYDDNTVVRLPKNGIDAGPPFVLANGQNNPSSIATDAVRTDGGLQAAQNVYWATGAGTILKVAR